jgi:hypothetical protein
MFQISIGIKNLMHRRFKYTLYQKYEWIFNY